MAQGEHLWRTLLLNAVPRDQPMLAQSGADDRPVWERQPDSAAEDDDVASRPSGPVDLYTWQSRRVRLVGDSTRVTGILVANGDRLTPQNRWRVEPMSAWRRSVTQEKKLGLPLVYMPQTHVPGRALWRGLATTLPLTSPRGKADGGQAHVAAGVVEWAARALERRHRVQLRAVGMTYGTQNAMVDEVVDDRLAMSIAVLDEANPALPQAVIDAVQATEVAVLAAKNLASNLARAAGAEPALADGARERVAERAYAALDGPFREWLADLDESSDPEAVRIVWHRTSRSLLHRLGDELVAGSGPGAWVGREVRGRRLTAPEVDGWFRRALAQALPIPTEHQSEEDVE